MESYFQFKNPDRNETDFEKWWGEQFNDFSKSNNLLLENCARELHASLVKSLSEDLEKTVETLLGEILDLCEKVPVQNKNAIKVIKELKLTRGTNQYFCLEAVQEVLERSHLDENMIAPLPLCRGTPIGASRTSSTTPSRVLPGMSNVRNTGASFLFNSDFLKAKECFDPKYGDTLNWMFSQDRRFPLFKTFLMLHTTWESSKITGPGLHSRTECKPLTDKINTFMDSVESFRVTPQTSFGISINTNFLAIINSELKDETTRMKNRLKSQRSRIRKKGTEGSCVNTQIDVDGGLGMGWIEESDEQFAMVPPINPAHLRDVIETIEEIGFIDVEDVMDLVLPDRTPYQTRRNQVIKTILDTFPVLSVHVHQSSKTYLVDGLQPPACVFEALSEKEPLQFCTSNEESFKTEFLDELDEDIAMWKKLLDEELTAEFATEIYNEGRKGNDDHECATLKKYPELLTQISEILGRHGIQYCHGRRRTDKIYHCGVSARSVSRYLLEEYAAKVSPTTIWRLFTHRKNDKRSIRSGGHYGMIYTECLAKKNSQFSRDSVIGHFVSSKMRMLKEWVTWLFVEKDVTGAIFHVDEMSKIPLIHDATTYLMLNKYRGSVLAGDGPNCFDHNFLPQFKCTAKAGEKGEKRKTFALKMTLSGVVVCMHDIGADKGDLDCKDQKDRASYKRALPKFMLDSMRCPYKVKQYGMNECEQHWNDITAAYEFLDEPRPSVVAVCSDNGNSYSPHHMMNSYYADVFMKKFPNVDLVILCSFAPGQSSKNHEIERMWAQHKKQFPGCRFGAIIVDNDLRAPKDEAECIAVIKCAAGEITELIQKHVNVCEVKESICVPEVRYVEPPTEDEMKSNEFIHEFFMSNKKGTAEDAKFAKLRELFKDITDRSSSSICQTLLWKTKDHAIRKEYFGESEKPIEPEIDPDLSLKQKERHYRTFKQSIDKYYKTGIEQIKDPNRCPREKNTEDPYSYCCGLLFLSQLAKTRHYRICHAHPEMKGRHSFEGRVRKRPSVNVVKEKTIGLSGRRVPFDFAEKDEKPNKTPNFDFREDTEEGEEGEENEVRFVNPTANCIKI